MSSTDDLPNQNRCPTGLGSWCRYNRRCYERQDYMNLLGVTPHTITEQQMLELDVKLPEHKHIDALPHVILKLVKPIYDWLVRVDLLERCLDCHTQNACESINALMWQGCPKELCSRRNHLDFATADSIINFNSGKVGHGFRGAKVGGGWGGRNPPEFWKGG